MKKLSKTKGLVLAVAIATTAMGTMQSANAQYMVYDAAADFVNSRNLDVNVTNLGVNTENAAVNTLHLGVGTANAAVNLINMETNKLQLATQLLDMALSETRNDTNDIHYGNVETHNSTVESHNNYIKTTSETNNNYYAGELPPPPEPEAPGDGGSDVSPPPWRYLTNFHDATAYVDQACFGAQCSEVAITALQTAKINGINDQKKASDAMLASVDAKRSALGNDRNRLSQISSKTGDEGYAKQMQLANALAVEQVNNTVKLHDSILQQQTAELAREQAVIDTKARQAAFAQSLRRTVSSNDVKVGAPQY